MSIVSRISLSDLELSDRRITSLPSSRTRTGYGRRLPTCQMVRINRRWRRVYVCLWSNSGTCYIDGARRGEWIVVDD